MKLNKKNSIKIIVAAVIFSSLFSCFVYANTPVQVYVDGYRLNHFKIENGATYVQLRELSHYIGYDIEFNEQDNLVNFYKSTGQKPVLKREPTLFPVNVEEIVFDNHREIIKVYELSDNESPSEIQKVPFEKNGYYYELSDITKSSSVGVDSKEHSELVTFDTSTQDMNAILKELPETKEIETEDGYKGVLKLDIGSIQTDVQGYNNSSYNVTETREYPNLSSPDTSLVPKEIQAQGRTLKLSGVSWKSANTTTVDYSQLTDTYTAVAVYSGTATRTSVTGYTTSAMYVGEVSKTTYGKTVYTAYFSGRPIDTTPELPEPTIEELEQQLKELKAQEKAEAKANGNGGFNPLFVVVPLLVFSGIGGLVYLLLFRRNVKVFSMFDGEFKPIGKTRVQKKNPVIDLTPFTAKVTTPNFIIVLDKMAAKRLNSKTVTINYGDSSFQHIVTLAESGKDEKKKGYQIEVDF